MLALRGLLTIRGCCLLGCSMLRSRPSGTADVPARANSGSDAPSCCCGAIRWFRRARSTEAISVGQRRSIWSEASSGELSADGQRWLEGLAELRKNGNQYEFAIANRRELLTLSRQRCGADGWQVVDARLDLEDARLLARLPARSRRRLRQAEEWNEEVVRRGSKASQANAAFGGEGAGGATRAAGGKASTHGAELVQPGEHSSSRSTALLRHSAAISRRSTFGRLFLGPGTRTMP